MNDEAEQDQGQTLEVIGARLGEIVADFEAHPQVAVRNAVFELLDGIDALHRAGISRLVELLVEMRGDGVLEELAADPLAAPVLELYDLLPQDECTQAEDALDAVRPYIQSHGGEIEVLDVVDGVVHVRLTGSCSGCSGSAITLRRGVEEALRTRYAGFKAIEVHEPATPGAQAAGGFVGLDQLRASADRLRRPEWTVIGSTDQAPPGTIRSFQVEQFSVLLCNVAGEIYGFSDLCPRCSMPLHEGKLSGTVLICPWQNCAYDARTGKPVDGQDGGRLEVYPVAIVDNTVKLALNLPGAAPVEGRRPSPAQR